MLVISTSASCIYIYIYIYIYPHPQSQIYKRRYGKTPGRVTTASQLHLQSRDYCYWDGGTDDSFKKIGVS